VCREGYTFFNAANCSLYFNYTCWALHGQHRSERCGDVKTKQGEEKAVARDPRRGKEDISTREEERDLIAT